MERTTDVWEDRPHGPGWLEQTPEEVAQDVVDADAARKFFWCEACGVEKGERCKAEGEFANWLSEWSVHSHRMHRWKEATELERAMLKATDDEEA